VLDNSSTRVAAAAWFDNTSVTIVLNGERHELAGPMTVAELLARLEIDSRRVAVEHNQVVVKRTAFDDTVVREGDEVEIVNFVGGGREPWTALRSQGRRSTRG